jgi:hypothetical protein
MGVKDMPTNSMVEVYPVSPTNGSFPRGWQLDYLDTSGLLHGGIGVNSTGQPLLYGTPVIPTGHQDTGHCGLGPVGTANGQSWGVGVNFHGMMQNTPSSVILTPVLANAVNISAGRITQFGFDLELNCTGIGAFWYGQYTTVGN